MAVVDEKTTLWMFRVSMIEGLGFSAKDAARLANATKMVIVNDRLNKARRYEIPISWHDVAHLIEAGASPKQILRILL